MLIFRSEDFRPVYMRLAEVRAFIPPGTPLMACTATATPSVRMEIVSTLEMHEVVTISLSPNWPNVMYEVKNRTDPDTDFVELLSTLRERLISTPRVVVYCKALDTCADLFAIFSFELGSTQYFPPGAPELSDNRLFGMYHACTPQHSKDVIVESLKDPRGTVRVVFASMGMGVNLQEVNTVIHYGAPSSIEDYFQGSGRGGQSGESARSVIYWTPTDCPRRKEPLNAHHREVNDMRAYLENTSVCRQKWLMEYLDPQSAERRDDAMVCCDVCANTCV